jgi:hypothetical protein
MKMRRQVRSASDTLLLLSALGMASFSGLTAEQQPKGDQPGLSGYVLAPDGTPVSEGRVQVMVRSRGESATGSIDGTGRFRVVPISSGIHALYVTVPGLAPYRVFVTVPPSKAMTLPAIRLAPATYFRVRLVSSSGEPLLSPQFVYGSFDVTGASVSRLLEQRGDMSDADGFVTLGALPRGVTTLAVSYPAFAQTRLPDIYVNGEEPLLDGGTVTLEEGAVLHVDVVDSAGAPVAGQDVFIEETRQPPILSFRPVRTNAQGRVTVERLAAGDYRIRTAAVGRCLGRILGIARLVSVSGRGTYRVRIVAGGTAAFRLATPFGPVIGTLVDVSPDPATSEPPKWMRPPSDPSLAPAPRPFAMSNSCGGRTDTNGRVALDNFPPGPARVEVRFPNSRFSRRVTIPEKPQEIAIAIPDGLLPVQVTNALTARPLAAATVTWSGAGTRVEASTVASGDALLEGVGATPGTLAVTAPGYERAEARLPEPPGTIYQVALKPERPTSLQARVSSTSGEAIPLAIVVLSPENPVETGHIFATDAKGVVTLSDVPPGDLRLTASADGFAGATWRIGADVRNDLAMLLARGHRVSLNVDLPAETGPYLIRVLDQAGTPLDDLLDSASDRMVRPPSRVSLGPLALGTYVVDLRGAGEPRQARVTIVDRDVSVTIR